MNVLSLAALLCCIFVVADAMNGYTNAGLDNQEGCPSGSPCASGRGHPYRICRDDLSDGEMEAIEHKGFCTRTNRFVCVRAYGFAGCCRNPCATLTSDIFYEGVPLTNKQGCQLTCQHNTDCSDRHQAGGAPDDVPVLCVDGACCQRPLFDPDPPFRSEENHVLHSYEHSRRRRVFF